jgi:hypothetical protein
VVVPLKRGVVGKNIINQNEPNRKNIELPKKESLRKKTLLTK